MTTAFSKISVKHQTVIPMEIRQHLGVKPGDRLRYRLTRGGVLIDRAEAADEAFASFAEWVSEADERAYGDL